MQRNASKWSALGLLSLALLLALGHGSFAQEVVSGSMRFVTSEQDPDSDVTVSDAVGAVFANQRVVFQFDFARGAISAVSVSLLANAVDLEVGAIELRPDTIDENGQPVLSCAVGPAGTSELTPADTCQDVQLSDPVTTIRLSFSVRFLNEPPGGEPNTARIFRLVAQVTFEGETVQTPDFLTLQIAGEVAVDLGLEGPVVLDPPAPRQGDRVTLSFFVVNNDPENAGSVNSLDFELKPPDAADFTDMAFLQLACALGGQACRRIPVSLAPGERQRVQFQFITSPLVPTAEGESYQLRITVNAASRLQEGTTELTRANNVFVVNFELAQPQRELVLNVSQAASSYTRGQEARIELSVANQTAVPLQGNRLDFSLSLDGEPQAVDFSCTLADPLLALSETCEGFSLFIAETKAFVLTFPTEGLEPGRVYRLRLAVTGPAGQPAGERSVQELSFAIRGTVREGEDGVSEAPLFGPELRPEQLKIVPSATVTLGTTVVLSTTIKNSGNRVAGAFLVSFSFKPDEEGAAFAPLGAAQRFPRLGIGRAVDVRQAFDTGVLPGPGSYRIRVEVRLEDPTAPELDAQNNTLELVMNVVEAQGGSP